LLKLETVHGPLSCPPKTQAAQCQVQWPALAEQLGIDAGKSPPGSEPAVKPSGGCSCESAPRASDALWLGPVVLLVIGRRRS
ncbi:MAG TPA: hypothetical protein VGH87_28610, partial [Polyangiaceae bacterium]